MNSFAHYSFGAVCEWMFFDLAGIDTDAAAYQHIVIRPKPPTSGSNPERKPINWVKAHYDSIHGRISSEWHQSAKTFDLKVNIPANTTATVYLPAKSIEAVGESGHALSKVADVKSAKMENDRAVLEISSGNYLSYRAGNGKQDCDVFVNGWSAGQHERLLFELGLLTNNSPDFVKTNAHSKPMFIQSRELAGSALI